jgi:hypothetical protein
MEFQVLWMRSASTNLIERDQVRGPQVASEHGETVNQLTSSGHIMTMASTGAAWIVSGWLLAVFPLWIAATTDHARRIIDGMDALVAATARR